jgi:hypothetical protein
VPKSRIFTVGFELPGPEFEYIKFDSDQTLLDADIILYRPTLGHCYFDFDRQWNGKSILSESLSFSKKARVDHWRAEISAAVNAGKLVIVFLSKPIEYCRYTGERQFSGTGRSRVQTSIVTEISSYEAIPNLKLAVSKDGSSIRLEKEGAFLASYWRDFSKYSPYEAEIKGDFTKVLLKTEAGNRVVGASFHAKNGSLLFLPPLKLGDEKFFIEEEGKEFWTKEALKLGKTLVAALVGLAEVLKQSSQITPPPIWSLSTEFRLPGEDELEARILDCVSEVARLQMEKVSLEEQLSEAGDLRRLLFEQGKPLEHAILEAMRLLGFDSRSFSDGKSEFDGIFVSSEGRCLGEAEGKDNKAISIEKFSQLERNLQEDFARDEVEFYAKGILFGNAYRLIPPLDRGEFFTEKCVSAAKRVNVALVRAPDLFAPAKYLRENPSDIDYAKNCRLAIFAAAGDIVSFPTPPLFSPAVKLSAD